MGRSCLVIFLIMLAVNIICCLLKQQKLLLWPENSLIIPLNFPMERFCLLDAVTSYKFYIDGFCLVTFLIRITVVMISCLLKQQKLFYDLKTVRLSLWTFPWNGFAWWALGYPLLLTLYMGGGAWWFTSLNCSLLWFHVLKENKNCLFDPVTVGNPFWSFT